MNRSLRDILDSLDAGDWWHDANQALRDCMTASATNNGPSTLTVTVRIEPGASRDGRTVMVANATVKTRLAARTASAPIDAENFKKDPPQ